jgi:superfamily I DNA and/or RNA helicase
MGLARKLHNSGKSYRILSPYDAQRSLLESALKTENLPWEDRCFNVDSFQGTAAYMLVGENTDPM